MKDLIPGLFRDMYSKMTAVLCRHFGLSNIQIAEDIVSDTFLKASEVWAIKGIPPNPQAWLYTVAKNKTKDYFKRQKVFDQKISVNILKELDEIMLPTGLDQNTINDSQLAMLFAICEPLIAIEGQISLALQILCGFSINEVAQALLTNRETIKKRVFRAKNYLRESKFEIKELSDRQIIARLPVVLKTLYLLFNEGYYAKHENQFIRKELCYEAIRLAELLTGNNTTNMAQVNALIALMCYQSSRLEARVDNEGEIVLFDQQDKTLWNRDMIDRGNYYMVQATNVQETSKYHIEAAIAYWHTTVDQLSKWTYILQLYDQLIFVEYSPVVALNRAFAYAKVHGTEKGINEAEKLNLHKMSSYFGLLGYLYSETDTAKAINNYNRALDLACSTAEREAFKKRIHELLQ
ncbi:MAG: RNA polymerase subunit sigma [Sphingobacterium sp.]|jgi:RNA polymerase sigma-70 factor (ECF subfamily)|nr:RNA polymerase subunit sigma [Sphingobacterium sp.]